MPATSTTVGQVIDYLVALIPTLPACANAQVFDGWIGTRTSGLMVLVGDETEPAADATQRWAATGFAREEDYNVSLMIMGSAGGENQKAARDLVINAYEAIDDALVQDPTLGGIVRVALVDALTLQQTTAETAGAGRQAVLHTTVNVQNRIQKATS